MGAGDTGLEGVTLSLVDNGGNTVATTTTDADGNYSFTDLAPGDYTVVETQPSGYGDVHEADNFNDGADDTDNEVSNADNNNIISVSLAPNEDDTGNDFVEIELGSISGQITADVNNDDTGDSGLVGVTLSLIDNGGNTVATTTTDGNGNYIFADVYPGNYTVVETQPSGYADVSEVDGGDDADNLDSSVLNSIPVIVTPGESDTGNDFVEEQFGSVTGNSRANTSTGIQNLENVTLSLVDQVGNTVATVQTDANGNYSFTQVVPGNYTVVQTQPAGYSNVSEVDGLNDGGDDSDSGDNGIINSIPVIVDAGVEDSGNNFVETENGAISGSVQSDTDNDNAGNINLENVTINLIDSDGNTVSTTTTDGDGNYSFTDVTPGNYTVEQVNLPGYSDVNEADSSNDGAADTDNELSTADNDNQLDVSLDPGETDTGNDFVDEIPASISGNVKSDDDNDNIGETNLDGVTINLVDNGGNTVATTTTDGNGDYIFNDVTPGDYTIVQVNDTGYVDVTDVEGANDSQIAVTVATGQTVTGQDFVDEKLYQLSGTVLEDTNAPDANEISEGDSPIAGVTVELFNADGDSNPTGAAIASTTTDADGFYQFSDLANGDYVVVQTQPAGYDSVTDSDGNDDNQILATIADGDSVGNDFLEQTQLGGINGNVSEDTTGNLQGDTPLVGVTLSLLDSNGDPVTDNEGNPVTTTTNEDGNYLFENLTPGDYSVVQTQPADYNNLAEDEGGSDDDQPDDNVVNSIAVTVSPNETDTGNDFVEVAIPGNIKGRVWNDLDLDGIQDENEVGVNDVTVKLYLKDDPNTPIATTTTSDGGNYEFLVNSDEYFVDFTPPENTVFSPGDEGNDDSLDSDVINKVSGVADNITLLPGEIIELDAGISPDSDGDTIPDVTEGLIGDRDNDGIPDYLDVDPQGYFYDQNTGEIIFGGSIEVTGPGLIEIIDDGSTTGLYQWFIDGTPGIYTIDITLPDGYVFSPDRPPLTPALDATGLTPEPFELGSSLDESTGRLFSFDFADNPYYLEFELASGDPFIINNNIALLRNVATIEGRVWDDADRNGIEGGFESGVENITVTLIGGGADGQLSTTDDNTVETLITDNNGEYQFIDLTPGIEYQVAFDPNNLPAEYSDGLTSQDTGNNDQFDSDAEQNTGLTPIVTLNPGDAITDIDAGLLTSENEDNPNLIEGTPSPDSISGTLGDETIAGYKGQDTLTGGDGNDNFFYNETSDGVDIITDFTSGEDQIDFTSILNNELGYTGNNPIADGYVIMVDFGTSGTMIQIDFDAGNDLLPKDVVFLQGVSNSDDNSDNDFNPDFDLAF